MENLLVEFKKFGEAFYYESKLVNRTVENYSYELSEKAFSGEFSQESNYGLENIQESPHSFVGSFGHQSTSGSKRHLSSPSGSAISGNSSKALLKRIANTVNLSKRKKNKIINRLEICENGIIPLWLEITAARRIIRDIYKVVFILTKV
uniref:Uncharacterized protein n=1 Tax=Meloidogyne hapla TaxID=6305 RepID=A0A1I8BMP0_MELHA